MDIRALTRMASRQQGINQTEQLGHHLLDPIKSSASGTWSAKLNKSG